MANKQIIIPIVDVAIDGTGRIVDEIQINPQPGKKRVRLISAEFNSVIQEHLSFFQAKQYDLLLSANDRIKTCEEYLRGKKVKGLTEIEIIPYFAFLSMLYDALYLSYNSLMTINHKLIIGEKNSFVRNSKIIFRRTIENIKPIVKNIYGVDINGAVSDDEVIEFLRSLVFAHPCETNRAGFLVKCKKREITLYSPWAFPYNGSIVLRIYFNGQMYDLYVPFSEIQEYANFLIGKIAELKNEVEKEAGKER